MKLSLTMKFWQKMHKCPAARWLLDKLFLGEKSCWSLQDALVATVILVTIAFGLAFSTKPDTEYTNARENGLDPLAGFRECWVSGGRCLLKIFWPLVISIHCAFSLFSSGACMCIRDVSRILGICWMAWSYPPISRRDTRTIHFFESG